ncbi:MAG: MATE family efflux transporter [Anaeromyxobacter sp.]
MSDTAPAQPPRPQGDDHPLVRAGLLALAWPIFVEQALRVLIGTVDTFMVAHVGDDAVAGLGVANQFVTLAIILFNFVAVGASVVITHHLGAGDRPGAERIGAAAVAVNTWFGLLVSAAMAGLAEPLLRLMQLEGRPLEYALPFLLLMGGTLFVEARNVAQAAVLRAHGHTRVAMLVTVGQNVLNAAGNALLLFGWFGLPRMGVVGVALSSVASRLLASAALYVLVHHYTRIRPRLRDYFDLPRERLARILHIGLPAAGENLSWWLALMVVTSFVARMGGPALATQTYTMQVTTWVIQFSISIGIGTELLVGHLVGAGEIEAAYRQLLRSLRTGILLALAVVTAVAVAAPRLLGLFTQDAVVIATGALLLRIGLVLEPGRVFNVVVINSLRATGDVKFPVLVGLASMWGVWVPLAWLLGLKAGLGLTGVWISMAADEWLRGLLMYRRWRQRRWVKYARRSRARAAA